MKRVLIIRDGAIGDALMITPAIHSWAERGYEVHVACKRNVAIAIYPFNPHITQLVQMPDDYCVPDARAAWIAAIKLRRKYDIIVDMAGTCECRFLYHANHPSFNEPVELRRMYASGQNYYEYQNHSVLGGDKKYVNPELYTDSSEEYRWYKRRRAMFGYKLVHCHLMGSSLNKAYPWWPQVVKGLQQLDHRIVVLTTGPKEAHLLEVDCVEQGVDPGRLWATCADDEFLLRDAVMAPKYASLYIGPETGVTNAAAATDTPKVVMLSHSAHENLSKHWTNCYPIQAPAKCSPCYKIIGPGQTCRHLGNAVPGYEHAMLCMASIRPEQIIQTAKEALRNVENQ